MSASSGPPGEEKTDERGRAYISIYFECCHVFTRVYKNKAGTAYVGWCPKCLKQVTARVGKGNEGTDQRMFTAR